MKILLLTDCPPCRDYTGGLYLDRLVRFFPQGSLVCFAVTNRMLPIEMRLTPDLEWIPIEYAVKPQEAGEWDGDQDGSRALATAREDVRRTVEVPALVERAVAFGRTHGVDALLVVLEGQTMVRMALPVAQGLGPGVPLFSLIWDPLSWWLRGHKVDPDNSQLASTQFDMNVRSSRACAVASWAMAQEYEVKYQVYCKPVIQSLESELGAAPDLTWKSSDEFVLGMAGQFYAASEWDSLMEALDRAGWLVGGRRVRLLVLGRSPPSRSLPPERLDFRGWHEAGEAVRILSQNADVLYCPYPFARDMEEVARYSFPSKLPLYFAAGLPVVFHGPAYSSPARYLDHHQAALLHVEPDGEGVVRALMRYAEDLNLYNAMAERSRKRFTSDFTTNKQRENFFSVLGFASVEAALEALTPATEHSGYKEMSNSGPTRDGATPSPATPDEEASAGRDAYELRVHALEKALEEADRRSQDQKLKVDHLVEERDGLAARLAVALDKKRMAEAHKDHFGRHVVALNDLLTGAREREQSQVASALEVKKDRHVLDEQRGELEQKIETEKIKVAMLRAENDHALQQLELMKGTVVALEAEIGAFKDLLRASGGGAT